MCLTSATPGFTPSAAVRHFVRKLCFRETPVFYAKTVQKTGRIFEHIRVRKFAESVTSSFCPFLGILEISACLGMSFCRFSRVSQKPPVKTLAVALFVFRGVLGDPQKYRCTQRPFFADFRGVFWGPFGRLFFWRPKKIGVRKGLFLAILRSFWGGLEMVTKIRGVAMF